MLSLDLLALAVSLTGKAWAFSVAQLERVLPPPDPTAGCTHQLARFNVHRFRLHPARASSLQSQMAELALRMERSSRGIEVSNAGGSWHSGRQLFRDRAEEPGVRGLAEMAAVALGEVEHCEGENGLVAPGMLRQCDSW